MATGSEIMILSKYITVDYEIGKPLTFWLRVGVDLKRREIDRIQRIMQ